MNYENPKDKEFIIKLVQEYIDLQDQSGEGFSIIYTQERLKKQFETFNNQIKKEINRTAKLQKGKELTIYNCFDYYPYIFLYDKIITINNYLTKIESKELTKKEIIDYQKKYLRVIWYTLNYIKPESKLLQYDWDKVKPYRQRILLLDELINRTYSDVTEYEIAKAKYLNQE